MSLKKKSYVTGCTFVARCYIMERRGRKGKILHIHHSLSDTPYLLNEGKKKDQSVFFRMTYQYLKYRDQITTNLLSSCNSASLFCRLAFFVTLFS